MIFEDALLLVAVIAVALVDFKTMRIPNSLNVAIFLLGLVRSVQPGGQGLEWAGLSSIASLCLLLAIEKAYEYSRGRRGIGLGDIKFIAASCAVIGIVKLPTLLLCASIMALGFVFASLLLRGRVSYDARIPFGPFLAVSLLFAMWAPIPIEMN